MTETDTTDRLVQAGQTANDFIAQLQLQYGFFPAIGIVVGMILGSIGCCCCFLCICYRLTCGRWCRRQARQPKPPRGPPPGLPPTGPPPGPPPGIQMGRVGRRSTYTRCAGNEVALPPPPRPPPPLGAPPPGPLPPGPPPDAYGVPYGGYGCGYGAAAAPPRPAAPVDRYATEAYTARFGLAPPACVPPNSYAETAAAAVGCRAPPAQDAAAGFNRHAAARYLQDPV